MYEIQVTVSACAGMAISNDTNPGHQQLQWGLNLHYTILLNCFLTAPIKNGHTLQSNRCISQICKYA